MPIQQTQAKLWHKTQEERDNFDDLMISEIELKSQDFDDENFSPVFGRQKQEHFLEASDRLKKEISMSLSNQKGKTSVELVDEYMLRTPNHSYFRNWTYEKFILGFGAGYILVRELPIRNFYARCVIMSFAFAKFFDHVDTFLPGSGLNFRVGVNKDHFETDELKVYDRAYNSFQHNIVPTVQNDVQERTRWEGRYSLFIILDSLLILRDRITISQET